eukprot:s5495_g6.t1
MGLAPAGGQRGSASASPGCCIAAEGHSEQKDGVQSVVDQSQTVKDYAAAGSSQNQLLFVLIVVCVSVLGAMFFNRMRYYEKKHFI